VHDAADVPTGVGTRTPKFCDGYTCGSNLGGGSTAGENYGIGSSGGDSSVPGTPGPGSAGGKGDVNTGINVFPDRAERQYNYGQVESGGSACYGDACSIAQYEKEAAFSRAMQANPFSWESAKLGFELRGFMYGGVELPPESVFVARAEQIHAPLDAIAQEMRVTAVLDTSAGRVVGSGGRDLSPAQRALLQAGERYNVAPGVHGEVTVILGARQVGARLRAIGTTADFCPACIDYIEQSGGVITGPRTAEWPQSGGED
jgi:hypothetical protein